MRYKDSLKLFDISFRSYASGHIVPNVRGTVGKGSPSFLNVFIDQFLTYSVHD